MKGSSWCWHRPSRWIHITLRCWQLYCSSMFLCIMCFLTRQSLTPSCRLFWGVLRQIFCLLSFDLVLNIRSSVRCPALECDKRRSGLKRRWYFPVSLPPASILYVSVHAVKLSLSSLHESPPHVWPHSSQSWEVSGTKTVPPQVRVWTLTEAQA